METNIDDCSGEMLGFVMEQLLDQGALDVFFTSIFMGFSYSITQGISVGFLTYTLTKIVKGQIKDVHAMIWILDALFILNYISMALN